MIQAITVTLLRHLLPIGITTAFLFVLQVVPRLLFLAIALMEPDFDVLGFGLVMLALLGYAIAISLFIIFPIALFLERFAAKTKFLIILFPIGLFLLAGLFVSAFLMLEFQISKLLFLDWGVLIFVPLSIVFSIYWASLWLERGIFKGFKVLRKSLNPKLSPAKLS